MIQVGLPRAAAKCAVAVSTLTTTSISNTLFVTGNTTLSNANVTATLVANNATITTGNITNGTITTATITTGNITTANITNLVGAANTQIYSLLGGSDATALAFAIAFAEAFFLGESFFGFLLGLGVFQTAIFFAAIILPI